MFINFFAIILYKYGIFLSKTEGRLEIVTLNLKSGFIQGPLDVLSKNPWPRGSRNSGWCDL